MRATKYFLLSVTSLAVISCGSDDNVSNAPQASIDLSGEAIYNQCKACHTIGKDERNIIGPNLWGIVGSGIAAKSDFTYSKALQEKGDQGNNVWGKESLDAFLESPQGFAPGNKMSFSGIRDVDKRTKLIDYLSAQSD